MTKAKMITKRKMIHKLHQFLVRVLPKYLKSIYFSINKLADYDFLKFFFRLRNK